jgi:hypothetical protein
MSGESAYVRELADSIGPRPATTDAEARAADWVAAVFEAKGLEVSRQDIDTPRTDTWGPFITYVMGIVAVAVAYLPVLRWGAFVLALLAALLLTLDMTGRFTLASWLPKGPSQNVVAKHCPGARRNEKVRKIVVVANLDSARPSLITDTGLVRSQAAIARLTLGASWLIAILLLASVLPWKPPFLPYLWYVTIVPAVWLLFPMFVTLQRELVAKASEGADVNASGVAAMLGVVDRLIPEKGEVVVHAEPLDIPPAAEPVRWGAEPMPEDSVMKYSPPGSTEPRAEAGSDLDEELSAWQAEPGAGQSSLEGLDSRSLASGAGREDATSTSTASRRAPRLPFGDDDLLDDAFTDSGAPQRPQRDEVPRSKGPVFEDAEVAAPEETKDGKKRDPEEKGSVFGWLGVDKGWDAKRKGREIGSWDKFEDDDDDAGWKGGSVTDDLDATVPSHGADDPYEDPRGDDQSFTGSTRLDVDDPDFTSDEIARIRRKVTQGVDRELSEKEIWFVGTGAGEIGAWGMRALLKENEEELRDALFIGFYGVGTGTLAFVDAQGGPVGMRRADRRMISAAKRVARDQELPIRPATSHWGVTDVGEALRERYRAISIMAFDINGRLGEWRSSRDTSDRVSEENIAAAADFATALIREL